MANKLSKYCGVPDSELFRTSSTNTNSYLKKNVSLKCAQLEFSPDLSQGRENSHNFTTGNVSNKNINASVSPATLNTNQSFNLKHSFESNFIIYHQNIRGLNCKINEFIISVTEVMPSVICITEHHIHDFNSNPPYMHMYKLGAIYSRSILKGGGVCIYIHEDIIFSKLNVQCYCRVKDLEIVAIKFKFNKRNFIVYCIYKAPSGDLQYFFEQLENILNAHLHLKSEPILCGDPNIDQLASDYKKKNQLTENLLNSLTWDCCKGKTEQQHIKQFNMGLL
jgi:hypothetical protein